MKITPIQESFSAGELTERLLGRVSAPAYQAGVIEMTNFRADSRGPAERRTGPAYISQYDGNDGRIFYFSTSAVSGMFFILTDLKLTPRTSGGIPVSTNYITNPRFRDGATGWTDATTQASVDYAPDVLSMINNNNPNANSQVGQEITTAGPGETITVAVDAITSDVPFAVKVGTSFNDATYATQLSTGSDVEFDVTIPGTTAWITVENDERDATLQVAAIAALNTTTVTDFVTPYTEADLNEVHWAFAPGGQDLYLMHPNYDVYKLSYDYATDTFTFAVVTFTGKPASWTGNNWPRTGTFHEGRFWLGGPPDNGQTFWGSKSNDYENFTLGSLADDAVQFSIAKDGAIRWMASTKNLLVGTTKGEHIVDSVEGVITPSDIQITQQSAYGSSGIQAIQVGDQVFYVSPDRTKLRAMQYEWTADNWLSKDLTFFSEHITKSGIRYFQWAQNPNNVFSCVLENGTVALLTYERSEDIYGWYLGDYGDDVKDIAVSEQNGTSFLAFLNLRNQGKLYLEKFEASAPYYMDSHVQQVSLSPTTLVTDLDHLEGRTVQVLTDGAVHPDRVVSGGQITLEWAATNVLVGLQFISTLKTMPFDKGAQGGSGQPYMKRYNKIYIQLLDSAKPKINGERQPTRYPATPMNTREPNRTERTFVSETGWDKFAQVTVEQDLPLACNVLSISGELAQEIL